MNVTDETNEEPHAPESDTEIDLLAESDSDSEESNNGEFLKCLPPELKTPFHTCKVDLSFPFRTIFFSRKCMHGWLLV